MRSGSAVERLRLAHGATIERSDGEITFTRGDLSFAVSATSFPWEALAAALADGVDDGWPDAFARRFSLQPDEVAQHVEVLMRLGLIDVADPSQARRFHVASSYGYYRSADVDGTAVQPSPPPLRDEGTPRPLPRVANEERTPLWRLGTARCSTRQFAARPAPLADLAHVLECAYGTRVDSAAEQSGSRPVPSAGSIYALSLFVLASAVETLAPGVYRYDPSAHALHSITPQAEVATAPGFANWFRTQHVDYGAASFIVLLAARFGDVLAKYGERGYRYLLFEAGHVIQMATLAAAERELASVVLGGFDDDTVNIALDLHRTDGAVLYGAAFGAAP